MVARVAVKDADGIYDYLVPDVMQTCIAPGLRVVVPLGAGNRHAEGIIVDITDHSEYKRLKAVLRLIDSTPLCTPELIDLAGWISGTCFCSYYTALKSVMPAGTTVKLSKIVRLVSGADTSMLADRADLADIINRLEDVGGILDSLSLEELTGNKSGIAELVSLGILMVESSNKQTVKSKVIRMVNLKLPPAEIESVIAKTLKRAPVQAKMLEILHQASRLSSADLIAFSGGNCGALNAIVKKGYADFSEEVVYRDAYSIESYKKTQPHAPTPEQKTVLKHLKHMVDKGKNQTVLLRGITGSGKTEIFLQIIDHISRMGKQAIVLVPEISLTPQMVERFVGRFGRSVSVLHSSLSLGERYDEWQRILSGEVSLVVGARSAVFAPFKNLGIIILDEEQETTYKSENSPMYHARDVAMRRAKSHNAITLLASATPSVESYYRAKQGEYVLLEMNRRYNNAVLPKVEIVDMCTELKTGNKSVFSEKLREEIRTNLELGQQTILFLNRRGYNTFVSCRSCGEPIKCSHCDVTMSYHKKAERLICHYCDSYIPVPETCPACGSPYIRYFGDGTQKLEDEIMRFFPGASFIRMDMDTTSNKNSHEAILNRFKNEKIDILIGTQMVTKGLDFKDVTLVGVMAADLSLNMRDYKAYERSFALMTQVCGRAGRGDVEGRAVIQTYQPDNFVINLAKEHDYINFYENEIEIRKRQSYPPFCDILMVLSTGEDEEKVSKVMTDAVRDLAKVCNKKENGVLTADYITNAVPAPLAKLKDKFRWRALIKTTRLNEIASDINEIINKYNKTSGVFVSVDVNPNSIL